MIRLSLLAQQIVIDKRPIKDLRRLNKRKHRAYRFTIHEAEELRSLREEQGFTHRRLAELFHASPRTICTTLRRLRRSSPLRSHTPIQLRPSLWSQLVVIALKRRLPYRGFSALEIVSFIKTSHNSPSEAEREILDEVCVRYGLTWDEVPVGKVRINAYR